jgi:hypothetical protein
MEFRPVERAPGAFQQSLTPDEIRAVCRRTFGVDAHPLPGKQFRSERALMRNEYASVPTWRSSRR